jgi:hypothetical protein
MVLANRLLAATAVVLFAAAGAEAASMPVKAKPVSYVKVCSAYGAGFYYIPGSDVCLRVGGYVYSDHQYRHRSSSALISPGVLSTVGGFSHVLDRDVNHFGWRTRAMLIMDARSATPAGTVRTYISGGWQYTVNARGGSGTGANIAPYLERAFTQLGGLTFGYLHSVFDAWSSLTVTTPNTHAYRLALLFAYTAKFGNGLSATFSVEDGQAHRSAITAAAYVPTAAVMGTTLYGGQALPDFVANILIEQAWGSFQLSGALHQLRVNQALALAGVGDAWGWAGAISGTIKVASSSEVRLQAVLSSGALEYNGLSASGDSTQVSLGLRDAGPGVGPVVDLFDAFAFGTTLHRVGAWSATAQLRHNWTKTLRSTLFAGFLRINMPAAATLAGHPDFRLWQIGANTIITPAPGLDFWFEGVYTRISTDCAALVIAACAVDPTRGVSRGIFGFVVRGRRNF